MKLAFVSVIFLSFAPLFCQCFYFNDQFDWNPGKLARQNLMVKRNFGRFLSEAGEVDNGFRTDNESPIFNYNPDKHRSKDIYHKMLQVIQNSVDR